MSREDPIKAEKDFSATLDEQFPLIEKVADYKEAVEKYLVLEKQTRQSSDLASSKRVLVRIVDTLTTNKDWLYLNELLTVLTKKHGQLKSSIQALILSVIDHLSELDEKVKEQLELKVKTIETIRVITDKKIFVEVERAIVSKQLSEIYLNIYNDLDKATEILCDLQVETYSLMQFETKIEYILEQIRLTLKKQDYQQAKILSRKILLKSLKNFDKADLYKSIYLKYLLEINNHERDYIQTVKNSLLLIEIPLIVEDDLEYQKLLVSIIYHIVLSPYDNYQSDLINKIKVNPVFAKNVDAQTFNLLEIFTTNELIHWSNVEALYKDDFQKTEIFDETNYKNLQKRIVEHNLRIINQYYQFIKIDRLAYLLQLPVEEAESSVSELVNQGMIRAKINRPKGIIKFVKVGAGASARATDTDNDNTNELLNDWIYDVDKLLEEIDSIGHLINKEEMMYGIKQKA